MQKEICVSTNGDFLANRFVVFLFDCKFWENDTAISEKLYSTSRIQNFLCSMASSDLCRIPLESSANGQGKLVHKAFYGKYFAHAQTVSTRLLLGGRDLGMKLCAQLLQQQ